MTTSKAAAERTSNKHEQTYITGNLPVDSLGIPTLSFLAYTSCSLIILWSSSYVHYLLIIIIWASSHGRLMIISWLTSYFHPMIIISSSPPPPSSHHHQNKILSPGHAPASASLRCTLACAGQGAQNTKQNSATALFWFVYAMLDFTYPLLRASAQLEILTNDLVSVKQ